MNKATPYLIAVPVIALALTCAAIQRPSPTVASVAGSEAVFEAGGGADDDLNLRSGQVVAAAPGTPLTFAGEQDWCERQDGEIACSRRRIRFVGFDGDYLVLQQRWATGLAAGGWVLNDLGSRTFEYAVRDAPPARVTVAWTERPALPAPGPRLGPATDGFAPVFDNWVDDSETYAPSYRKHRYVAAITMTTIYYRRDS